MWVWNLTTSGSVMEKVEDGDQANRRTGIHDGSDHRPADFLDIWLYSAGRKGMAGLGAAIAWSIFRRSCVEEYGCRKRRKGNMYQAEETRYETMQYARCAKAD